MSTMRPFSWSLALEAKLMKCMDAELPKELDGLSFLAFMQDPTCNPKKTLRFISRYSSFIVLRCGGISITDRFSQTFTFSFTYILPHFFLLFCPFFTSCLRLTILRISWILSSVSLFLFELVFFSSWISSVHLTRVMVYARAVKSRETIQLANGRQG